MINYNLPILLTLALSPAIIHAATLNVDTNDVSCDDLVGTPYCTIDAAVTDSANGDIIEIAAGTYNENITVSTDITINGEDRETTIIDAGGAATQTSALLITGDVSVSNLTIQNGFVSEFTLGGGIAGIGNSNIVITDCIIKDNKAGRGGGIFSSGNSIMINRSRITNNEAYRITNGSGTSGAVSINTTTPAVIIDSTIDNNTALRGGMTQSISNLIIINSTISGNYASNPPTGVNGGQGGGAIINGSGSSGIVSIYNSTITGNSAASFYGGILNFKGTVTLYNTILAGNTDNGTAPDCSSTITSGGNNIIGTTQGCTLVNSTDDLTNLTTDEVGLSALGDFETFAPPFKLTNPMHALFSSSLAIDAGNPNGCLDNVGGAILTDQRGEIRPFDGDGDADARCDIGAFEKVKNIIVTSPDNFTTDETGTTADVDIVLSSAPNSDVQINLLILDAGEATVSPGSVSFGVGDWSTPKTVTVTGVDDDIADGAVNYDLNLIAISPNDLFYNDTVTVEMTNTDDEPVPKPKPKSASSGSLSLLMLICAPVFFCRRVLRRTQSS